MDDETMCADLTLPAAGKYSVVGADGGGDGGGVVNCRMNVDETGNLVGSQLDHDDMGKGPRSSPILGESKT